MTKPLSSIAIKELERFKALLAHTQCRDIERFNLNPGQECIANDGHQCSNPSERYFCTCARAYDRQYGEWRWNYRVVGHPFCKDKCKDVTHTVCPECNSIGWSDNVKCNNCKGFGFLTHIKEEK